jgi:hypothetical protein
MENRRFKPCEGFLAFARLARNEDVSPKTGVIPKNQGYSLKSEDDEKPSQGEETLQRGRRRVPRRWG